MLREIYKAGEDAAYATFCALRWPETDGEAICPECGCCETYAITARRKFKCKACYRQFSITSRTIFASRKLSFADLLAAICLFVNGSKGRSAVQLSRELGVQYKTAWVMAHKIRESMQDEYEGRKVSGEVEIDGAYFGGHIRPANKREDCVDQRRLRYQTGTRRIAVVARARKGRTLTFVTHNEADGVDLIARNVTAGPSSTLTRPATGITCHAATPWAESITRRPTATLKAPTRTALRASSPACAAW